MTEITRITFMMSYGNAARADVALTADKTYYRFATEDSIEDGELPAIADDFNAEACRIVDAFSPGVGVSADINPVNFKLFINNVMVKPTVLNRDTLRRFVDALAAHYQEFDFLSQFI